MPNRGKSSNNNNNKSQNDDDNCSIICYKDLSDGHVSVVRVRQQPVCSACNLMRGTLSLYYKHIVDNNHRENVKKLCDENRFTPSAYDQAIHLAFQNNFYYQSEKFHFLYKHTNEEVEPSSQENDNSPLKTTPTNSRKRRNIQVTLVFQDKTYTQTGIAIAQIREQLLKDMLTDRANDIAALPIEVYYTRKKLTPDDIHQNGQKGSVSLTMTKDQSEVLLNEQQQHQEPFENGHMSSIENNIEDNGVEQNNAISTQEINEQSSIVDDVMNIAKDVINSITGDVYTKSDEFKREQQFLAGVARRNFKKKNTFYCDICSIFLTSDKYCTQHLNGSEHLEKLRDYQMKFLPWRQAMQKSLITGKSLKEIMGNSVYDNYKATMAGYLAPNSLCSRGRFCCAYCELIFTDQWALEKHLHTIEHKQKQTSTDHKDLVVRFANVAILPIVFKFNGITHLSEVPEDIKNRYQWRCVTRAQLDEDISTFIRNYPYDGFEGVTRILNGRAARRQKSNGAKAIPQNARNNKNSLNIKERNQQDRRRSGFNRTRGGGGHFQASNARQGPPMKRPFPVPAPANKRFRPDLNNSFPGANRGTGPMRNYDMQQYNYNRPTPYNNGNDRWPQRYPNDQQQQQQQQDVFTRSNYELRSLPSDNNGYYGNRQPPPPVHHIPGGNNYNADRQLQFNNGGNGGRGGYNNSQSNYDPNFIHAVAQAVADYHPQQNSNSYGGGPNNRSYHRVNTGPSNELIHHVANNLQRSQQQQQQQQPPPPMTPMQHQNQNSFGTYGIHNTHNNNNNNNTNSPFFPSSANPQVNQIPPNSPSIRSYADYRSSTALPTTPNTHSSMYPQNSIVPQSRTFDEFGLSSLAQGQPNPYGQTRGPSYGNYGHQNQMEQPPQVPWRGASRGGDNVRGRGGGSHFQPTNKQPGSTFSYSSSDNHTSNSSSNRGRGAGRNIRNFGNRR